MKTTIIALLFGLAAGFAGGFAAGGRAGGVHEPAGRAEPQAPGGGEPRAGEPGIPSPTELDEARRETLRVQGQLDLLLATLDAHDRVNLLKVLERLDAVEKETRIQREQLNDALGNPAGGAVVTLRLLDGAVSRQELELKSLDGHLADLWKRLAEGRERPRRGDPDEKARAERKRWEEIVKDRDFYEESILSAVRKSKDWDEFYKIMADFDDEELLEYAIAERLSSANPRWGLLRRIHLDALVDEEQAAITAEAVRVCGGEDELLRRAQVGGAITQALHVELQRIRAQVRTTYDPFYRMWFSDRDLQDISGQLRNETPPSVTADGPGTSPATRRVRVTGGLGPIPH